MSAWIRRAGTVLTLIATGSCGGTRVSTRGAEAPTSRAAAAAAPSSPPPASESAHAIRSVDWANRRYDEVGESKSQVSVQDGIARFTFDDERRFVILSAPRDEETDQGWFKVSVPSFGDVTADAVDEAVLVTRLWLGGTGLFSDVRVFAWIAGDARALGTIPGGDRGSGGIHDARIVDGAVQVDRLLSGPDNGACCPSQFRRELWRWDGRTFVEDTTQRTMHVLDAD